MAFIDPGINHRAWNRLDMPVTKEIVGRAAGMPGVADEALNLPPSRSGRNVLVGEPDFRIRLRRMVPVQVTRLPCPARMLEDFEGRAGSLLRKVMKRHRVAKESETVWVFRTMVDQMSIA